MNPADITKSATRQILYLATALAFSSGFVVYANEAETKQPINSSEREVSSQTIQSNFQDGQNTEKQVHEAGSSGHNKSRRITHLMSLAKRELSDKHYPRAISAYDEVLTLDPSNRKARLKRALVLQTIGGYEDAIKDLSRLIADHPETAMYYEHRGWCFLKINRHSDAMKDLNKAIHLDDSNITARRRRGALLLKLGDYQSALSDFNKVIALDPDSAKTFINNLKPDLSQSAPIPSQSLSVVSGAEKTRAQELLDYSTDTSSSTTAEKLLASINNEAAKAIKEGRLEKAIGLLEDLACKHPDYTFARNNLTIAYNNQGLQLANLSPDKSIYNFRVALFYTPAEAATRKNLNSILREKGLNPNSYETRISLGDNALEQGDLRGAFVEYSEALRLDNTPLLRKKLSDLCIQLERDLAPKDK